MAHERKASETGVRSERDMIDFADLPLSERAKLATLSVSHGVGVAATTGADHTEPTCCIQYTLDAGLNPPLFPVPQTEKKSSQPDNSSVVQHHPADMWQEI